MMVTTMAVTLEGIEVWLNHPVVQQGGWVLVHFLWQGALVAGVLAGALAFLRTDRARLRYALSLAALVVLLALPVATWLALPDPAAPVAVEGEASMRVLQHGTRTFTIALPPAEPAPSWIDAVQTTLAAGLPGLVLGWLGGVLVLSLRMVGGWVHTLRIRRSQSSPVPDTWQHRAEVLAEQVGVKSAVRVRQSARIDAPMVVGWIRPVVLLPISVLTGLPPEQVEALIAHELAHIRRHDVLVGRMQAVAETLLFYHPAVWWVSRQLRIEREHCCDDLVVCSYGHRVSYARALTTLAARRVRGPVGAMAATDGVLLTRIRRLVGPATSPSMNERVTAVTVLSVVVGVLVTIGACASQQPVSTDSDSAEPASAAEAVERRQATGGEAAITPDTTQAVERRAVTAFPDSSERVVGRVGPDSVGRHYSILWNAPVDSNGAFALWTESRHDDWHLDADSLSERVLSLLRRPLAGRDTIAIPPIPGGPRVFHFDSLDVARPPFPPEPPFTGVFPDTVDFGAWQEHLDALGAWGAHRPWGVDSLDRARIDSLRSELHRELRERREEIRRLTRERREEIERLHRERRERLREEQSERLREQAERLRRQAERLEEQARELERSGRE